ncbi:hypothetical protein [Pleurocapsa sp. PCC 7319]|uniref:hypothetical protein n=1 Tax=Pleurocapsa sp. PCC 7319 TaxID=118161 RepID=UPI00034758EA|nr:hypothetical protein [Pleurocapsa sp. PCC 7319]
MELHQRTLLEKRSFFLLPNKIKLYLKDPEGEHENHISYENLRGEVQIHSRRNPQLLFLAISAASFAVGVFFHCLLVNQRCDYVFIPMIAATLLATFYQIKKQNYIIVETFDRRKVIFLKDRPNRRTLEVFLNQLWLHRKKYLRDKYFYINHNHDLTQQTERLKWLLEQNVITKAEFKSAQEDWIIDKSYQS